jgi:Transposase domain (DUF772)
MWGADIEAVVLRPDEAKRSKAGRKPFDAILMFRMLILQFLYNLSDDRSSIRCATGCVHAVSRP